MMVGIERRTGLIAAVTATVVALAAVACTPVPPGGGTTTTTSTTTTIATPVSPVIASFTISGGVSPAPSVVALAWSISDPNGDALTCRLDGNGDGTAETVISNCPSVGSRNVSLPAAGTFQARLEVDDATFAPVAAVRPITVAAGPSETYNIELRGVGSLTPAQAAAFTAAEARWEGAILRGVQDTSTGPRPPCLPSTAASLPAVVDDLIIDVSITPIDGPGGILGQAGPNCINGTSELSTYGVMEFDSADVANLIANGSFGAVILHEMGHVLGFGTLWDLASGGFGTRQVITGAGGADPRFTGGRAVAALSTLGGSGTPKVEAGGGPGTRDAHWSESTFANELMTGFLNNGSNPLSQLSLSSLADLGYQVDLSSADAYSLPSSGAFRALGGADLGARSTPLGEVLRPPLGSI